MRKRLTITVALWSLLALMLAAPVQAAKSPAPSSDKDAGYYELMKEFVDVFEQVDRNYVKDVDRRKLMQAAIRGMLEELDPYSTYIGPQELERFTEEVEQQFGGIGIHVQLDPETRRLTVLSPLPGTPAYRAGVKAGDIIEEIDGRPTKGFSIPDAVKLMRGRPGEPVVVTFKRAGSGEVEKIKIVRDVIEVPTVMGDHYRKDDHWDYMVDEKNKIGYVRLTHFSRRSADELREAVGDLQADGMKGLILDLRFNPGGLLSQATEIADMFIKEGCIVSTKGKNTPERVWEATGPGTYGEFPMAILVNRFSASASEILSACLQDHKRAVIVGERTWGKGSVQNVIDVGSGASALKLTTASYHRPSGKNIHRFEGAKESDEWGVLPDEGCDCRFSLSEITKYLEYRRERDVLSRNGPPESDFIDRQLAVALEKVREKLGVQDAAVEAERPATKPKKTSASRRENKEKDKRAAWQFRGAGVGIQAAA